MTAAAPMAVDPRWKYDALAKDYDRRPDYDASIVDEVLGAMAVEAGGAVMEIGAGTGKFTAHLCARGWDVVAVEPSAPMRQRALEKPVLARARWIAALGERLPVRGDSMDAVAYASSLNCLQSDAALNEAHRVLRPGGHLLALWNYRDLYDPLQASIEQVLAANIPGYDPGSRRRAPMDHPSISELFGDLKISERRFTVDADTPEWIGAWNAHQTVVSQAGDRMPSIIAAIRSLLDERQSGNTVRVPYITRIWSARVRK